MTRAIALAILLAAPSAHAQRDLADRFTLHARLERITDLQALACSREHAYVRSWMGNVVRWNGAAAPTEIPPPAHPAYGRQLWVAPNGNLFLTASARVAEWDGSAWIDHRLPEAPGELGAMWGIDARTFFIAARASVITQAAGSLERFDAGTWRDLSAIWGTDAANLFVGGQGGTIMRRRGARFVREDTGTGAWIRGIFGTGEDEIFAWGDAHNARAVLHFDGERWSPAEEGLPEGEVGAIGGAEGAIYAVGAFGIARWDEGRWSIAVPRAAIADTAYGLNGVCATSSAIVVSDRGGFLITRPR